jgi:hypothetical protein
VGRTAYNAVLEPVAAHPPCWALYSSSTVQASADYKVEADVYVASAVANDVNG